MTSYRDFDPAVLHIDVDNESIHSETSYQKISRRKKKYCSVQQKRGDKKRPRESAAQEFCYPSAGAGGYIRYADNGFMTPHIVGTPDEDYYFKVSMCSGAMGGGGRKTLFYGSPREYCNHLAACIIQRRRIRSGKDTAAIIEAEELTELANSFLLGMADTVREWDLRQIELAKTRPAAAAREPAEEERPIENDSHFLVVRQPSASYADTLR